jgi:hypothetical protein
MNIHDITKQIRAFADQLDAVKAPEKPDDGPPWIEWRGGPCPLRDDEVEEWEYKFRKHKAESVEPARRSTSQPSIISWTHENLGGAIIAYRVLKARKPAPKQPLGPGDKSLMKFKLWSHLHNEHGLTLIDDELHQIIRIVREVTP